MDAGQLFEEERIVFLGEEINEASASNVIFRLLYLDAIEPGKPIKFYISSPGGSVYHGLAIIDIMNIIKSPVHTIAFGLCASMATVLLVSGDKRIATKNATIMVHEVYTQINGHMSDVKVTYDQVKKLNGILKNIIKSRTKILSKHTYDRDLYLSASEALKLGVIDEIGKGKR